MKKNIGKVDRAIRIVAAMVIITLYALGIASGLVATIFLIFIGALILTSSLSWCPLYLPFGINTRKDEETAAK